MERTELLQALCNYQTRFDEEQEFVPRFMNFINNFEKCYERSLQMGHITGSAWITDAQGTSVLLVHHKKLDRWLQPGGHADGMQNIIEVATKEAEEETGLRSLVLSSNEIFDIDIHTIPTHKNIPQHEHYDIRFHFVADITEKCVVSAESNQVAWFPIDKIASLSNFSNSLHRMVYKSKMIFNPSLYP